MLLSRRAYFTFATVMLQMALINGAKLFYFLPLRKV